MDMETVQMGDPFPDRTYAGMEGVGIVFTKGTFDVIVVAADIRKEEEQAWFSGQLTYGLFVDQEIPFLILEMPYDYLSDCSFNVHRMDAVMAEDWLQRKSLLVRLLIIEKSNYVLRVKRTLTVSPEFMYLLKSTLRRQIDRYVSHDFVERKIAAIQSRTSTGKMQSLCGRFQWRIEAG